MALLERPDDLAEWQKTLSRCVENGLFTQEEADSIASADGIEDYILETVLKPRLLEKSVNKAQFGFAYEALYRQLVKQNS